MTAALQKAYRVTESPQLDSSVSSETKQFDDDDDETDEDDETDDDRTDSSKPEVDNNKSTVEQGNF